MAAAIRVFGPSKLRSCPVAVYFVQHRASSTSEPLIDTKLSALKRGTGGRSSFSGVVATVFGANGFVGRNLINKLGKIGTQVIVPYRCDAYNVLHLKLCGDLGQILFLPFNLKDEESIYKAVKHSNVVINLIGKINETSNFSYDDVHVTGARTIARIAKECNVQRLIHVSALNACESPTPVVIKTGSRFYASKWTGEQAVREVFPEAIIFRPSDIYGQGDNFLFYYCRMLRGQIRSIPMWNKGRNVYKRPVYVGDFATGIVNSIFEKDAAGKTYEAVGPHQYELKELIEWFLRVLHKTPDLGYRVSEMKYAFLFRLKVSLIEKIVAKYPVLCWERIERENVTDTLTPGLPSLEDLGVTLTEMEDRLAFDLEVFRNMAYENEFGPYGKPKPAPVVLEV